MIGYFFSVCFCPYFYVLRLSVLLTRAGLELITSISSEFKVGGFVLIILYCFEKNLFFTAMID